MRLLILHHPTSITPAVHAAARESHGRNLSSLSTRDPEREITVVSLENPRVEAFIAAVEHLPELGVVLIPHEVMSIPPDQKPDEHVEKAGMRSPLEIYLDALNTVGGWWSFLAYAAIAGLLAWAGFYSDTMYLLIAAMLVAPYPNPVLNTAIATARGDGPLLLRSVGRYFLALLVGVLVAFVLSAAYQIDSAGDMARAIASLSTSVALLPLAAGIVGGIYLSESEKSSLVSAAAASVLVTAALSPPVAILGMAAWTREGGLALRAVYLLLLQIAGINLTAAAVFRLRGLGTRGPWYRSGRRVTAAAGAGTTVLAMTALSAWQFYSPDMRRGSTAREAISAARARLDSVPQVAWISGESAIYGEGADALLVTTIRAHWQGDPVAREDWNEHLTHDIQSTLRGRGFPKPLVQLILLE